MTPTVGVLALQGGVERHLAHLRAAGAEAVEVRTPADLLACRGLVLPGGESTTMSMLLDRWGLRQPIADRIADGLPVFGTCAGMILLANEVEDGRADQASFAAIDVTVRRNGYGRQNESFEAWVTLDLDAGVGGTILGPAELGPGPARSADVDVEGQNTAMAGGADTASVALADAGSGESGVHAVFIRAPRVVRVGDGVTVLARHRGDPVVCEQGAALVAAFHPELTSDLTLHHRLVDRCREVDA